MQIDMPYREAACYPEPRCERKRSRTKRSVGGRPDPERVNVYGNAAHRSGRTVARQFVRRPAATRARPPQVCAHGGGDGGGESVRSGKRRCEQKVLKRTVCYLCIDCYEPDGLVYSGPATGAAKASESSVAPVRV